MKNCLIRIGLLLLLTSCHTQKHLDPPAMIPEDKPISTNPEHQPISGMDYSPTNLIIMYDAEIGKEPLQEAIREIHAEIIYDYHIITGMAIRKPETMSLEATKAYFEKVKGVVSVAYDHIYHLDDPIKPKLEER
jgi:hypothetical protein